MDPPPYTEHPCADAIRAVENQGNIQGMSQVSNDHTLHEPEQFNLHVRQRNTEQTFNKPASFAFTQVNQEHPMVHGMSGNPLLHTKGELHIKEDHKIGLKSIRVEVEVHHDDRCHVSISGQSEKMTMTTKSALVGAMSQPQPVRSEPSVSAKVTIWVSRGLDLSSFNIHTDSLDVILHDNVPIPKHTRLSIRAPSSSFKSTSHKLPSSRLTIDALQTTFITQSGSVTGDFTLRDALKIHTLSGSININLSLVSTSDTTSPATLDLQAQSGSIKVDTTTISTPSKIPNRDYHSTLRTQSGSIRATLVHGSTTTLHSSSSSIHASLYPHGDAKARSDLITAALSGSTDITVHPSLSAPSSTPLRHFHASHTAVSGSIRILYPSQWEGTVEGSTVSGAIRYDWPGLKIVERGDGWGQKKLKGVKGEGEGRLAFRDVSGSVELKGMDAVVVLQEEGMAVGEGLRPAEEEKKKGDVDKEEEVESVTEVGDFEQKVLTPGSEAGDEWLFVQ
ncbi:MAG: hypothetical protein Q9176_001615 [Flavoplaca citrina]